MILAPKKYILGVAVFRLNCSLDSVSLKKRYFKLSRDIYICIVFSNMILPVRCAFTNQNLCDEFTDRRARNDPSHAVQVAQCFSILNKKYK